MPKTDGYKTREKILSVAEQLFADKGFNGTSIDMIAKTAGVNKGLIYYHFKDKKDVVESMFAGILKEIDGLVSMSIDDRNEAPSESDILEKIKAEIEYCQQRKRIISVMLMEALKADGNSDFLFKCSEIVLQQEMDGIRKKLGLTHGQVPENQMRMLVSEFFTGFIPIISFVTLQEKWCEYFGCDKEEALEMFVDAFSKTHLNDHMG